MFEEIETDDDTIIAPGHHPQIFASFSWDKAEADDEAAESADS